MNQFYINLLKLCGEIIFILFKFTTNTAWNIFEHEEHLQQHQEKDIEIIDENR